MGNRAKQVNITIPEEGLSVLKDFDQMCAAHGMTRSAQVLALMQHWLGALEGADLYDPRQPPPDEGPEAVMAKQAAILQQMRGRVDKCCTADDTALPQDEIPERADVENSGPKIIDIVKDGLPEWMK